MSLLHVDWNPDDKKIRQFGAGVAIFTAIPGLSMLKHGKSAAPYVLTGGLALGILIALQPAVGRIVYRIWMSAAVAVGAVTSFALLAILYCGVLTPLALFFRLRGRDVLRLVKPTGNTYWRPLPPRSDNAYYERLF